MNSIRLNKFIANKTGLSRRYVDSLIERGIIQINGKVAALGEKLSDNDRVEFSDPQTNKDYDLTVEDDSNKTPTTILLNKPEGYICSRDGQGNPTIYELLPERYSTLKIAGRLDKDSSGLVLLSSDGELIDQLTHPKYQKTKVYQVHLDKLLEPLHQQMISDNGIMLDDGLSKFTLEKLDDSNKKIQVTMREGRNRQIRRTFEVLDYKIIKLHRTHFGSHSLNGLKPREHLILNTSGRG